MTSQAHTCTHLYSRVYTEMGAVPIKSLIKNRCLYKTGSQELDSKKCNHDSGSVKQKGALEVDYKWFP